MANKNIINVAPLIKRLKSDIEESKKYEKLLNQKCDYAGCIEEVNNRENFKYFLDLINQLTTGDKKLIK